LIPFVISGIFNLLALFTVYLAPMYPFVKVLGPPIAKLKGVQYLHYPYNFILLPELFSKAKNYFVNPFISSVMIAVAVGMIYNYYTDREPKFSPNFNKALRKYISFVLTMGIMVALSVLTSRFVPVLLRKILPAGYISWWISFLVVFFMVVAIEAFLVYVFLSIMVKGKNLFSALKESILFSSRFYFVTYLLVLIPRLFDLATNFMQVRQGFFMNAFLPDITLAIIALAIIVAVVTDGLVYTLISNFYILKERSENENI
jgi:putative flippase GtrA